jgi:hypothetical protein
MKLLLRCMSLEVVRNGHAGTAWRCLLLRVERTCRSSGATSGFDPQATFRPTQHPAIIELPEGRLLGYFAIKKGLDKV